MTSKIALLQANPVVGDIAGNAMMICGLASIAAEEGASFAVTTELAISCLLYTSPSPRDRQKSRMPSSA